MKWEVKLGQDMEGFESELENFKIYSLNSGEWRLFSSSRIEANRRINWKDTMEQGEVRIKSQN